MLKKACGMLFASHVLGISAMAASPSAWDAELCRLAQQTITPGLKADQIKLTVLDDGTFPATKTSISSNQLQIYANLHGGEDLADRTVDCKLLAADRIRDQAHTPVEAAASCAAVNQLTLTHVLESVAPEVREAYAKSGRQLEFDSDLATTTGGEWLRTNVSQYQKAVGKQVQVRGIKLEVPWNASTADITTGVHYCKLLSSTTVQRWIEDLSQKPSSLPLASSEVACVPAYEKNQGSCLFTPPFLEEEICQDYTGLAWNDADKQSDCSGKEGVYAAGSCGQRQDNTLGKDFARCVIQCSKPAEKIWNLYSDPSKYSVDMNKVCDRFTVAPKAPSDEVPVSVVKIKIAGDDTDIYLPQKATPSPLLLFFQGGRVDKKYYQQYAQQVAAAGFVVLVPNHFSSMFDDPELFSEITQIPLIQQEVAQLNQQVGSRLFGSINNEQLGLLGHSFGAAAIIDAIQNVCRFPFCAEDVFKRPDQLKAVALTGISTKPLFEDKIYPTANLGMPIAFINGRNDSNATYADSLKSFQLIQDPPKMFVAIKGANHYNVTDANSPAGPAPDEAEFQIPQAYSIRLASYWTVQFLRAHILNDEPAKGLIYTTPDFEDATILRSSIGQK